MLSTVAVYVGCEPVTVTPLGTVPTVELPVPRAPNTLTVMVYVRVVSKIARLVGDAVAVAERPAIGLPVMVIS